MLFNRTKNSKQKKEDELSTEVLDSELLDLEDDILSEAGGGNAPNMGCGVNNPN
ncbi:hypothetical protein HQQ94_17145 [Shewanella sp. VB17]|uniref:hypothetical protein n=1 Tax=Shewanella sp. VB17 TaxID=2739432 RepID=UPI001565F1FC|nr:hypothetical protein [Shewanella sp. VB17]NRD74910.1 hypothetical protein [Shewanella sp. VB17]